MSKLKRARAYIGKRIVPGHGWRPQGGWLVEDVVVAPTRTPLPVPGTQHSLYHSNRERTHTLAFKGPALHASDGPHHYEVVNSRVRHEIVEPPPAPPDPVLRRARVLLRRMEADRAELEAMPADVKVRLDEMLWKGK